jgi:hypothetical protein
MDAGETTMRGMLLATAVAAMASAVSVPATAQDREWPEGSAMNVGGLENKRLDAAGATRS